MVLCWGFNHDEALRSFREAARLDPDLAMAWWGIAYALGPNLNLALTDETKAREAHRAAQKAAAMRGNATPVERALIDAMAQRYADPPPEERQRLDHAYASAMREVAKRFPHDPDVATLFADALMLLSKKWRQWAPDGDRGPHTDEFIATLERLLAEHPDHPGLNHFYIHAVEASTRPRRGLPAADRLGGLVPAAGHLVHMPSHIYIRLGLYDRATATNEQAIAVDDAFFAGRADQGIYSFYRAHNHHFLVWSAMFQGARERALRAARDMVAKLPKAGLEDLPRSVEVFLFVPIHVMIRFGLWQDVLAEPPPETRFRLATTLWHHARAIALANLGRHDEAHAEVEAFEKVAATIPRKTKIRRASIEDFLVLARHMMMGEVLYKQGRHDEAFVELRKAVKAEDALPYAEPPGWMQPVRHALGALLLEAGRVAEAEAVYRADLELHAENGWSLHGLAECLRRQGEVTEAAQVSERFKKSWAHADTEIRGSCFCRRANAGEP